MPRGPIELARHAALCVEFRADSYVCGDGDALRFWATAGSAGADFLKHMAANRHALPGSCVHAWRGEAIVGQVGTPTGGRSCYMQGKGGGMPGRMFSSQR